MLPVGGHTFGVTGVKHQLPSTDEARALGGVITAVDPSMLRQPPNAKRRWWKGGEPYLAVTADEDGDGLVFVEVCVRGRFARRRRSEKVETGFTDELEVQTGDMPKSRLEQIDGERADVIAAAQAVLEGAGLTLESAWLVA